MKANFLLFVFGLSAALGAVLPAQESVRNPPLVLTPESTVTVSASFGTLTSITIKTSQPLENVMKGGPEINHLVDGNVIHIQPTVPEGKSSITFRVGGAVYTVRIHISPTEATTPNPVFTIPAAAKLADLDRPVAEAAALRPGEIDFNGAVRTIQRAESDGAFRDTLRNFAQLPIRKVYPWNGQDIHLLSATQFGDQDLIVFKISWVNSTSEAFYLNDRQYQIYVGDRAIPLQARRQLAPRAIVFPGQQETVWLGVQGYKLRLENDWDLRLPAEARQVQSLIARK